MSAWVFIADAIGLAAPPAAALPPMPLSHEIVPRYLGVYLAEELLETLAFGVVGPSTSILINREGRETARLVGPTERDNPEAIAQSRPIISHKGLPKP